MAKISEFVLHFLANAAWQIAGVAICASICARLLRNVAPRYRHALWVASILLCLAIPLWGLLDLQSALLSHQQHRAGALVGPGDSISTSDRSPGTALGAPAQTTTLRLEDLLQKRTQTVATSPSLTLVLAIAYALFALYRLSSLWRAWLRTCRLRRSAYTRELPANLASVAASCQDAFGLKRISLAFSAETTTPATIGVFQPVIILPESFYTETSDEILAAVLGHEMAHIARRDFILNLVYEFLCLPISFHPIANHLKRQIVRTRELACDDMVTERLLEPEAYARSLLRVAGALVMPSGQALSLGVFDADILEERIMKLVCNTGRPGKRATRLLSLCAISLLCVTGIAVSTFSFDLRPDRSSELPGAAANRSSNQNGTVYVTRDAGQTWKKLSTQDQSRTEADVSQLVQLLTTLNNAQVRAEAACSAGKSGAIEAIPMLVAMLGDDTSIQPLKCWDEGRWSPALDTFKQHSPGEQAAIALASMGSPAIEPLTNALNDSNSSVRRNAAWAIGELTNMQENERANAVPTLIALLGDSDEWVRMAAAQALGEIRDDRAIDGLIELLGDSQWQPRKTAAWALGEMKAERAVEALCNSLLSDQQPEVRLTAAWALGEVQDKRAVEALFKSLVSDQELEVRRTTAWALGEIQGSTPTFLITEKRHADGDTLVFTEKGLTPTLLITEKLHAEGNTVFLKEKADYGIAYATSRLNTRKRDKTKVTPVNIPNDVTVKKSRAHEE